MHEGHLSLKDADDEQSNVVAKMKNLDKSELKLQQEFMNEIVADEKDINDEFF